MTSAPPTFAPENIPTQQRSKGGEIRAVCLDIDDTLIDYTTSARCALSLLVGDDDAWSVWQEITEEYAAKVIAGELAYETMHRERTKAFFATRGEHLDDAEAAGRERRRKELLDQQWQLFSDALPCLDWLRGSGYKLAAVTNASGHHQRAKLAMLNLAEYFDHVLIAGELGAGKPDPVIFHTACLMMGVEPAETAHVGDRLDADAIGARDAGLRGVWLDRAGCPPDAPPEGITAITSLADLPELLVCDLSLSVPRPR